MSWRSYKDSFALHLVQYFAVLGVICVLYDRLPSTERCVGDDPERFCHSLAVQYTARLVDIGPRPAGSPQNEEEAVALLSEAVAALAVTARWPVEWDWQSADGSFFLSYRDGMTLHYQGVQNLVVRVRGRRPDAESLLLNSHFDSVPLSPGASDDAISCGVMLELLRVLSHSSIQPDRDVVFLFNGAEESILPAAHGFISSHKWAKQVGAFINLEAAGAGGREVLFQAGPGNTWLLSAYLKNAPYSSASVVAQEVFQGGVIPSDTDFRIFRDFGNLSGLDLAFIRNGYVYHTRLDDLSRIHPGSVTRVGENVLAVVRALTFEEGSFPEEQTSREEGPPVFFETLGFLVVHYSSKIGVMINLCACLFAFYIIHGSLKWYEKKTDNSAKTMACELLFVMMARAGALLISLLTTSVATLVLLLLGRTMSWYSFPLLVIPLYVFPTLLANMLVLRVVADSFRPTRTKQQLQDLFFYAITLEFTTATLLGTLLNVKSSYIPMLMVIFPSLAHKGKSSLSEALQEWYQVFTPIFNPAMLLPLTNVFYLAVILVLFFVPIMGRIGSSVDPDIIMCALVVTLTHVSTAYVFWRIPSANDVLPTCKILAFAGAATFALVAFTRIGFPYSEVSPQRISTLHTARTFYNSSGHVILRDSGVAFTKMDYHDLPELDEMVPGFAERQSLRDCQEDAFINCGLPFDRPVLSVRGLKQYWMPFKELKIENAMAVKLDLDGVEELKEKKIRLNFTLTGPKRVSAAFSTTTDVQLVSWSFTDQIPNTKANWRSQKNYFVAFQQGKFDNPLRKFSLVLKPQENRPGPGLITVMLSGHLNYDPIRTNDHFTDLLRKFPSWTFPWAWSVDLKSYEFNIPDMN